MSIDNKIIAPPNNQENKDIPGKESPEIALKKRQAGEELTRWSKKEDTRDISKIVTDIVDLDIPIVDIKAMLDNLNISAIKRSEIMSMVEQKQSVRMHPKEYQQSLQASFPNGVPDNAGEMAKSMLADVREMYKNARIEIDRTNAGEKPSESAKQQLKEDRAVAVKATTDSEGRATQLGNDIARSTEEAKRITSEKQKTA